MSRAKTAAIAIVFSKDKTQILLAKRRDAPIWVLPGGGVEEGEDPSEAAVREALEETCIHSYPERLIGKYYPTNSLGHLTYVYSCLALTDQPSTTEEAREAAFFPLNALPKPLFFLHTFWIKDALLYHPIPFEKPLEGITYLNLIKHILKHPLLTCRFFLSRLGIPWNSK